MKEIKIFASTKKLAKKYLGVSAAITALFFLFVLPDEDIAEAGLTGFLGFVLFAMVIGMLGKYFYELSIAKKNPVLIIDSEMIMFNREKKKVQYTTAYSFSGFETKGIEPESDGDELNFLVDNKESYLYIWKEDKKVAKIRATLMNINNQTLASFLSSLCKTNPEKREDAIKKFYDLLMEKLDDDAKTRVVAI